MSETPKLTEGQAVLASDLARYAQAMAEIGKADIDERAHNNPQHKEILTELAISQWMLENPKTDANRDTLEMTREDVAYTKRILEAFEANGHKYPHRPEEP